jgi:glycosyltransferase involved in cell wall biosynthesis
MRIGHYMIGLSERGGIAMHTRKVSTAQLAAGHEVVFFDLERCRKPSADFPDIHYVPDENSLLTKAEKLGVDILHAHILLEHAPKSKVPVLRTLHGHEPYCPSGGHYLGRQQVACKRRFGLAACTWGHVVDRCGSARPLNLLADLRRTRAELRSTRQLHVITVSEYLRQQMIRNGYDGNLIHTLHPPAPPAAPWTPLSEKLPRFLFIGRVTPSKGVDWLLKAAAMAKSEFAIDIAGDGNAMAAAKKMARGISRPVQFHGWLDHQRTEELLRNCRALVVPSLWPEPAGLVALEAMAAGRCAIVAGHGGLPELVGEAGIQVPPGDAAKLAEAMDQLASDKQAAEALGQAGQRRVNDRFKLEQHLPRLLGFYRQAIEEWRR